MSFLVTDYAAAEYKMTSQYIIRIMVTRVRMKKRKVTLAVIATLVGNTYQRTTHAGATTSHASAKQATISYVVAGRPILEGFFSWCRNT